MASDKVPEIAGADREILVERDRGPCGSNCSAKPRRPGCSSSRNNAKGSGARTTDLKPLRNREDFRKLLVEIEEEVDRGPIPRAGSARPDRP